MSVLSLGAAGFIYYWIKETRGLTDKEKRSVFQEQPKQITYIEASYNIEDG